MVEVLESLCTFLDWDTTFFGYRIAKVVPTILTPANATKIDQWSVDNEIDCLYFMADSQHAETIRIAEDHHYRHVDVRVVYEFDLKKPYQAAQFEHGLALDIANPDDTQAMLPMIDNAFVHTRFYYDSYFSQEQSNNLYRTWLIRSIEDDFADRVFVIRKQGKPQAFITCTLDRNAKIGSIGLIGVADFARGQNLGSILVFSSFAYFADQQMERVQIVTQGRNIAANRLYQKCGFRTSEIYLWYHKWFTRDR